ncbi:hypothetical protein N561_00955 [Gallibacterium anatis 12656/12]|uniref:Uncharacterized protein n=1 Tax=Gallibacterium anatis 12656/12 TaxID=1195244 RepID=U1H4W8_9PAST|nr:hypothetical protein N561_00955 [Gallibacterium anatis 12656/12]
MLLSRFDVDILPVVLFIVNTASYILLYYLRLFLVNN